MRVIILTVAIFAALAQGQSTCSGFTDCYDCTTASLGNCGWCQDSFTCSQGTATGPNSGTCTSWDWVSGDCPATPAPTPDACAQYSDCYDCTTASLGDCGWCQDTYTCSQGTGTGPNQGTCTSWDWVSSDCPATPPPSTSCSQWTDCDSCTTASTDNCGWCQDTYTCSIGTSTGPSTGTCTSWDWISSDCPANKKPMPKTTKKVKAAAKKH